MNEVMKYTIDFPIDEARDASVASQKNAILGRLARDGCTSYMELMSLSSDDAPLENYGIINSALEQLEQSSQIHKTYELTDQANAIVGYELSDTNQPV